MAATSTASFRQSEAGLALEKRHVPELISTGMKIMEAVEEQVPLQHPLEARISEIKHTLFTGPADVPGADAKNAVMIYPRHARPLALRHGHERRMAQMYARGLLGLNQDSSTKASTAPALRAGW